MLAFRSSFVGVSSTRMSCLTAFVYFSSLMTWTDVSCHQLTWSFSESTLSGDDGRLQLVDRLVAVARVVDR